MILREATAADLPLLLAFLQEQLPAWGYQRKLTAKVIGLWRSSGFRFAVVYENDSISAALMMRHTETDKGPAVEILIWIVAFDCPRKLLAFDTLAYWGCNLMRSEGYRIVFSRRETARAQFDAAGHFGMTVVDEGYGDSPVSLLQWGDTEKVIAHILKRRPEWQISL